MSTGFKRLSQNKALNPKAHHQAEMGEIILVLHVVSKSQEARKPPAQCCARQSLCPQVVFLDFVCLVGWLV
jgi:hypothetical protein